MKYEVPETVWDGRKRGINRRLCFAFAEGCGSKIVKCGQSKLNEIATYGIIRGTAEELNTANHYWYMDNAYFGHQHTGRTVENTYYRITRDNTLHSGLGDFDWNRFNSFGFNLKEFRISGDHVVIVPPDKTMANFLGVSDWLDKLILKIKKYTDREIIISRRPKSLGCPDWLMSENEKGLRVLDLKSALKKAWVLVTDHSNAMTHSLIEGVPIICTHPNRLIGSVEDIENPILCRDILKGLAYNQWTVKEIRSGKAWEELNIWG